VHSPWILLGVHTCLFYASFSSPLDLSGEVAWGLTVAFGCVPGSSAMDDMDIWAAVEAGDVGEVERLVGQDPGLLNATGDESLTPLMIVAAEGHVGVVRCLLDKTAAIDERTAGGWTALCLACHYGRSAVVMMLLEGRGDPTIADNDGWTPLMQASSQGRLEVVRVLLGHPSAKATINHRNRHGETALVLASYRGRGGVARALLEGGADPTIASNNGVTPTAVAKRTGSRPKGVTAEGRRECVAALEVRF
jgi:ankyrin repeat protein